MKQQYSLLLTLLILTLGSNAQLQFTENRGQWPDHVLYQAKLNGGCFWAEKDRFTLEFIHPDDWEHRFGHHGHADGETNAEPRWRGHVYQMVFEGANPDCEVIGLDTFEGVKNYFIGSRENWASGVRSFSLIFYKDIYPGVDLRLEETGDGHLKYSFDLVAGVDPGVIRIRYDGADVHLDTTQTEWGWDADTRLVITTSVNEVIESDLVCVQHPRNADGSTDMYLSPCRLRLADGTVTFEPIDYDTAWDLTIDPVLTFSTYTGSTADNFGFTAAHDTAKLLVAGGIVFGNGYPTTVGAYDASFNGGDPSSLYGGVDVGITKFNANGSALIYSTYIGGSGDETPNSIIVNSQDELLIFGITGSSDFPTTPTAYDKTFAGGTASTFLSNGTYFSNGTDMYVAKLSADGSQLLGSTYVGGTSNDGLNNVTNLRFNYGDQFRGEVVVDTGDNVYVASSTASSNFPTTPGAFKTTLGGGQDGCVVKLSPDLSSLIWATYLGGTNTDASYGLKVRPDNSVVVAGGTTSTDFPTTPAALNPAAIGGVADGYLALLSANGANLLSGTYLGTSGHDQSYFVELDDDGYIYTYGQAGPGYPVTAGVYNNANSGQFITKLNSTLSGISFSTVFGKGDGNPEISPTAFLVDRCQNIYCSGWGGTTNSPGLGALNTDTDVSGMPLTSDAYQSTTDGSDFYFFVVSKDAKNLLYATYFGGNSSADHVDGGTSRFDADGIIYEGVCASCGFATNDFPTTPSAWSSSDQSSTPQANCNMAVLKFEFQLTQVHAQASAAPATEGCVPFQINFSNSGSVGDIYEWDFGDGNTSTQQSPSHLFTTPGVYTVRLIAFDTLVCNSSDTMEVTITVFDYAVADFSWTPSIIYVGDDVTFTNMSTNATGYLWDFGDGNTSTDVHPVHSYSAAGTYTVCLTATNAGGCNDSICKNLLVRDKPVIDVPTAFSPNGDDKNEIFYVRGHGVETLKCDIYNRWGQLLYTITDLDVGWDGTFKGIPQEMEVYVFVLDATLIDGNTVFKKGNITLIR